MVDQLIAAMQKEMAKAVATGFCHDNYEDFVKFDLPRLQAEAMKGLRWVWTLTPYGTNLSMYGVTEKSNEWASAILHSGHSHIKVFRIDGFNLLSWTRQAADAEVKRHEMFKVKGSTAMCAETMIATFEAKQVGLYEKRSHEFHFKTESKVVEKMHLIGMRELAIQEAVRKEHSLFAKISAITVNGQSWEDIFDVCNAPKVTPVQPEELMLA